MKTWNRTATGKCLLFILFLISGMISLLCGTGLLLRQSGSWMEYPAEERLYHIYENVGSQYIANAMMDACDVVNEQKIDSEDYSWNAIGTSNLAYAIFRSDAATYEKLNPDESGALLYRTSDFDGIHANDYVFQGHDGWAYFTYMYDINGAMSNKADAYDADKDGKEVGSYYYAVYRVRSPLSPGDMLWEAQWIEDLCSKLNPALMLAGLILFAVAALILLIIFLRGAGYHAGAEDVKLRWWDKIPAEIFAVVILGIMGSVFAASWDYLDYGYPSLANFGAALIAMLATELSVMAFGLHSLFARIHARKFWRYTLLHYLADGWKRFVRLCREHTTLVWKWGGILAAILFFNGLFAAVNPVLFLLLFLVELAAAIKLILQMQTLQKGAKDLADGTMNEPLDTSRMLWDLKNHGEYLNQARLGVSQAAEEKIRSERMKTELITNVSHDIKTPLTSIINYVDLIKKEEVENETVKGYVDVLERQSLRLKRLLEDLIEASKVSTGNVELELTDCDAVVVLEQAVGEFLGQAEEAKVTLVKEVPQQPISVLADGRALWRILENLLSNICKYSAPNSRAYITLEKEGDTVQFTFKNVSAAPLNITAEELKERFVRGDESRHSEGSGLGLSIAGSLAELMDGSVDIVIDGDLFKAIVILPEGTTINN